MKTPNLPIPNNKRKTLLDLYGEKERLVRDPERKNFTSLSRSRTTQLEKEGKHPKRKILGTNSVAWLLSDLLLFINKENPGLED
jgi:predicted DNA-binding transcriptional regulator AlpA